MGDLGICGVRRGKTYVPTTISNELKERPKDLVKRALRAPAPNPTLGGRHRASRPELVGRIAHSWSMYIHGRSLDGKSRLIYAVT